MEKFALTIILDVARGGFQFDWRRQGSEEVVGTGLLLPCSTLGFSWFALEWAFESGGCRAKDRCNRAATSVRALLRRIFKLRPLVADAPRLGFRLGETAGAFEAGRFHELSWPPGGEWSGFLARTIHDFIKLLESLPVGHASTPQDRGRVAMRGLLQHRVALPDMRTKLDLSADSDGSHVRVTCDMVEGFIQFDWSEGAAKPLGQGRVTCSVRDELR